MNLNKPCLRPIALGTLIGLSTVPYSRAGVQSGASVPTSPPVEDTRYGLFNGLDHRSGYGEGVFPEPFLNDDSDLEVNELRLDWLHTGIHSDHSDELTFEYEKGFGPVTLEAEFHYNWEKVDGTTSDGFGNIDFGARTPFFQYVSADRVLDTTFGVGIEVGIPTNTDFSQSTEVVPKIFNDTRLGDHLTVQTIAGYSALYGGDEDGIHTLEYGVTVGYTISHKDLAIPGVQQLIPVFEVAGETQLNKEDSGESSVVGNAGFRVNLKSWGVTQPRLGMGYIFPLNSNAREDMHWGVVTSLVFEF